jgi:hypothetical protein
VFSRRLTIAAALALVLHAIGLWLIPPQRAVEAPQEAIVARVTLAHIVRTPTPRPSPTPTPPPHRVLAALPSGVHARVERIKHAGARRPTPPKVVYATPDAAIPTGAQAAGAQNGAGAGSVSTVNGNGNGAGNAGTGLGNGGAYPCGAIDFESTGVAALDDATGYYERSNIVATVYFSDGSYQKTTLDWTWHYKSEDQDPFLNDAAPMLFQFPPTAQRASEPAIVQYIIAHTYVNGRAELIENCPNIPAVPSPGPQRHA